MSKTLIISENYTSIDTTLYLATRNDNDDPVIIVILGNRDLFKLFQILNEKVLHDTLDLIYIEMYQPKRIAAKGIKKALYILSDILGEKRYLKKVLHQLLSYIDDSEVFFFSRSFSGFRFYLLKKLKERNKLVYVSHIKPGVVQAVPYTPIRITDWITLILLKLIYGLDVTTGILPYMKPMVYMPDSFMEKEVDRTIDYEEKNEMLKKFDLERFKVFDVGEYDVIYFGHNVNPAIVSPDRLSSDLEEVFKVIIKHFPENRVAIKYHPNRGDDEAKIKIGETIPPFIPAEFLFNESVKVYLSLWSVSIANIDHGIAVSLLNLITFFDNDTRNHHIKSLIQYSKSEILFPGSFDELERILVATKN